MGGGEGWDGEGGDGNGQCRERDGNRQAERAEVRDVVDRERRRGIN